MPGHRPLVIGHRGAPTVAPENTVASFVAARAAGADAVELDVHQSSDGHLVVVHDYDLDRTTDGAGPVFGHEWRALAALDAGSWFGPDFAGERLPRLEEVLELDGLRWQIELKGYGQSIVDRVLGVIESAGQLERVEFTSANGPLLAELRRRQPRATTGLFTPRREPWMSDEVWVHSLLGLARYSCDAVVHLAGHQVTPRLVEQLHDLGKLVNASGADRPEVVEQAVAAGADQLSTDEVALAVATLDGLGADR